MNLFDISERVVILTGGAGKLGRQYDDYLRAAGAKVAVLDLPGTLSGRGFLPNRMDIELDICDMAGIYAAIQTVVDSWGVPHALINNAAIDFPPASAKAETEKVFKVNLFAPMRLSQIVAGIMSKKGRGSIVNISSIYGMVSPRQGIYPDGFEKPPDYGASKAALDNFTKWLATKHAFSGVRVNTLTLGGVEGEQDQRFKDAYSARVPMGRMARENEYRGAVHFLISDASKYMTGANLVMDGGYTAW